MSSAIDLTVTVLYTIFGNYVFLPSVCKTSPVCTTLLEHVQYGRRMAGLQEVSQ